jgi:purine-nucleoside phosphorylase
MYIYESMIEAKEYIENKFPFKPEIGIVLGSGLGDFAETVQNKTVVDYSDIPNFKSTKIKGHKGKLVLYETDGVKIAILQGRFHYYEGHDIRDTVFPIRVLGALGVKKLILTNAAGGINPEFIPGDLMIITDHINMMGVNPLRGDNDERIGVRFPDMSNIYTKSLVKIIENNMKSLGLTVRKGTYLALSGPSYETPAEIKMLKTFGADAVGMSTVPEAIAARHIGMEIAGISCITNLAAGISKTELNHKEVTEIANKVKDDFIKLLTDTLNEIVKIK